MNIKILTWKYHLKSQKIPMKENLVVYKRQESDFHQHFFLEERGISPL